MFPVILAAAAMFAADAPADESISVTVVGTLRTGIVVIGGETTGTTITSKNITWELDFRKNAQLGAAVGATPKPGFHATVGRTETRIRFLSDGDATIIDITSATGIDKATIKRETEEWPKTVLVRLHLGGLESFKVGGRGFTVEWSVASTGDHAATMTLVSGKRVAMITKDSSFYSEVRMVGGEKKIPLKDGYFEVRLPATLFDGNPEEIKLEWVDFYRN